MCVAVNTKTFEVVESAHTPDYEGQPDWLINPLLPAAPKRYRKWDGAKIVEMKQAEKDAVDATANTDAQAVAALNANMKLIETTAWQTAGGKLVATAQLTAKERDDAVAALEARYGI